MEIYILIVTDLGALAFGLVIGWVTYRTLRNSKVTGLSDLASVLGAVGGAAVTALFPSDTGTFGAYCIGLAIGFFAYLYTAMKLAETSSDEKARQIEWLGSSPGEAHRAEDASARRPPGRGMAQGGVPRE